MLSICQQDDSESCVIFHERLESVGFDYGVTQLKR